MEELNTCTTVAPLLPYIFSTLRVESRESSRERSLAGLSAAAKFSSVLHYLCGFMYETRTRQQREPAFQESF
jgi:hypothetical protein